MRALLTLALTLFLPCICFVPNSWPETVPADFRGATWGMSPDEVKSTEPGTPFVEGKASEPKMALGYKDRIDTFNCHVAYTFIHGKLVSGMYIIKEEHTNQTDYLEDFKRLWVLLSEKYGKPIIDRTNWKNDLYKNDPSHWRTAVAIGHMTKGSKWETPNTDIILSLHGDNFKIGLVITYTSKEFKYLDEELKKKEAKKKL